MVVLYYLCDNKVITAKYAELYFSKAKEKNNTEAVAVLLSYLDKSDIKKKIELYKKEN